MIHLPVGTTAVKVRSDAAFSQYQVYDPAATNAACVRVTAVVRMSLLLHTASGGHESSSVEKLLLAADGGRLTPSSLRMSASFKIPFLIDLNRTSGSVS